MILESKQLIDNLLQENLLQISTNNHKRTWKYYYEQYHNAFRVLLDIAKQKCYRTNCKFMPFLFIMRHSLELFLKMNISEDNKTPWKDYGKTHKLEKLFPIVNIDAEFIESFDCLDCNSEGDCFRYLLNKKGDLYFDNREEIRAFEACNCYCLLLDNDNSLTKRKTDKGLLWELTFHAQECNTLGIIGTQYDFVIIDILRAIQNKEISINDVYLPLLFLLRHCLEIKLKSSIIDLGNIVNEQDCSKAYSSHSVKELYDILASHINEAIKSITDPNFKKKSEDLGGKTKKYKDVIAQIDPNSYSFRFPKNKNGNIVNFIPKSDDVSKIIKLYRESDTFLCFCVDVLFEAGVLKIGDDKEKIYNEKIFSLKSEQVS